MSRKIPLYDRIFETLRAEDGSAAALSRIDVGVSEELVLGFLKYNCNDVLSCMKLFDWAGRQPGFFHTRATFTAIFKIISKAKLKNLVVDFLENYSKNSYSGKRLYHNVLVIGYSIAGQCETALNVFGRMRFLGLDLDRPAYNVLLNSLVDKGLFEFADCLSREIRTRGYTDRATNSIMVKSYCKRNDFERAEEYLRSVMEADMAGVDGYAMSTFITALCKSNQLEKASALMEEFKTMGTDTMHQHRVYSAWLGGLVRCGKTDDALAFMKDKQIAEEYVPDVFRFNLLIHRLLRENRLVEVYDLLIEMNDRGVLPDNNTMNAVLCFLCKGGMRDIAMGLYNSKKELGLSVNRMGYNYLINTLSGEANAEDSYKVLKNSLEEGYFPGQKTLSIVTDALCREDKLDKVKELAMFILEQKIMSSNCVYDTFVAALCRADKVEEAYMFHELLAGLNRESKKGAYYSMIHGFCKTDRGDIGAKLLMEMQESCFRPSRRLFRDVLCCIFRMDKSENRFLGLLEMQLSHSQISPSEIFEIFIDGAGHAGRPELALHVYDMMKENDFQPNLRCSILLLQCYLKCRKISDAIVLFCDMRMRWRSKKLWNVMIVGLCRIREPEYAAKMLEYVQQAGLTPSLECYESLIKVYCDIGRYNDAIDLLNDMTRIGRRISSFIGNVFLLHSLKSRYLYEVWVALSTNKSLTPASWMLGHLIGIFCGSLEGNYINDDMETLIQRCFEADLYTYNMMLRRLSTRRMDDFYLVVRRLREKGYAPNRWTYDTIIYGLARQGREEEARKWMKEMALQGFDPVWQPRNRTHERRI